MKLFDERVLPARQAAEGSSGLPFWVIVVMPVPVVVVGVPGLSLAGNEGDRERQYRS
jgi:hypothetical protein